MAFCSYKGNVLFMKSSPSIMVTKNLNFSASFVLNYYELCYVINYLFIIFLTLASVTTRADISDSSVSNYWDSYFWLWYQ